MTCLAPPRILAHARTNPAKKHHFFFCHSALFHYIISSRCCSVSMWHPLVCTMPFTLYCIVSNARESLYFHVLSLLAGAFTTLAVIVYGVDQGRDFTSLSWGYALAVLAMLIEVIASLMCVREYISLHHTNSSEQCIQTLPLLSIKHSQDELVSSATAEPSLPISAQRKRSLFHSRKAESLPESQLFHERQPLIAESNHEQHDQVDIHVSGQEVLDESHDHWIDCHERSHSLDHDSSSESVVLVIHQDRVGSLKKQTSSKTKRKQSFLRSFSTTT